MQADRIERAVAGDESALVALLVETDPRLCRIISRRIPPGMRSVLDAADIVQEVHIEVFRRIATLEPRTPVAFERWVSTIAVNKLRHAIERHNAAKRCGGRVRVSAKSRRVEDTTIALLDHLVDRGRTPSSNAGRRESLAAMDKAMSRLPEAYRQAIRLVHIEERGLEAAAAEMGRTERAVHALCHRGKKRLRTALAGNAGVES